MSGFEIQYMPSHELCSLNHETGVGGCWCKITGFTSYRMASIFAYHHCMCCLCKAQTFECSDLTEKELLDMSPGKRMEALWGDCICSAEWWITEIE